MLIGTKEILEKKKSSMNINNEVKLLKLETFKDWIDQSKDNIFKSPNRAIIEETGSPIEEENSPTTGKPKKKGG
jgi:hypothetical protein